MATTNEVSAPTVVVNTPKRTRDVSTYGRAVCLGMENQPLLPNPSPSTAEFKAEVDELDEAATQAETKVLGATAVRNVKERRVRRSLGRWCGYVQSVIDKNVEQAAVIANSVCMSIKKPPQRTTPELSVTNGAVAGQALLRAKKVAPHAAYYWEYSLNQTDWIVVPETLQASTVIAGLPLKATVYFRFRALTRTGKEGYSQVVSLFVM